MYGNLKGACLSPRKGVKFTVTMESLKTCTGTLFSQSIYNIYMHLYKLHVNTMIVRYH